jgi:hypothetical protein
MPRNVNNVEQLYRLEIVYIAKSQLSQLDAIHVRDSAGTATAVVDGWPARNLAGQQLSARLTRTRKRPNPSDMI